MSVVNEERNYTVYMHINKINGKKYIGITKLDTKKRWGYKGRGYINNQYFYRSIKKYDWDEGFEHIIIGRGLTKEEAEYFEILLIKLWECNNKKFGYNIANGGNSIGMVSEETKKKISESNKGRIVSEETRKKSSKSLKGKNAGENNYNSKKVICENKIFNTIGDCAKFYNVKRETMNAWLLGKCNTPQKYIDLGLNCINSDYIPQAQISHNRGNCYKSKMVICDNIVYDCIIDCAEYYQIKPDIMRSWLRGNNKMPKKFIDLDLHYLNNKYDYQSNNIKIEQETKFGGGKNYNAKKVTCDGKIFDCAKDCAKYYNINYGTMNGWLNGRYGTPQNFIDMGLCYINSDVKPISQKSENYHLSKKIICNDVIFNSVTKCASFYNIKQSNISRWLNGTRPTPQKYIDLGLRYYNPEADGDIEQYEQYIAS